jgi:hypothetical protein
MNRLDKRDYMLQEIGERERGQKEEKSEKEMKEREERDIIQFTLIYQVRINIK